MVSKENIRVKYQLLSKYWVHNQYNDGAVSGQNEQHMYIVLIVQNEQPVKTCV